MNIDWSKAPEGFPIWIESHYKNDPSDWHRQGENCFIDRKGGRWDQWQIDQGEATPHFKPTIWTGEGLPPSGTRCATVCGGIVRKVEILCVTENHVFMRDLERNTEWLWDRKNPGSRTFRPIRTPEQIAEEARLAELNLMIGAIKDHPGGRHGVDHLTQLKIHEEVCINLYEAGWRKQVVE